MSELSDIRTRIDAIDSQLVDLFRQRQEISDEVAAHKLSRGLPVLDRARERAKLKAVASSVEPELRDEVSALFSLLMELSKERQRARVGEDSPTWSAIEAARAATPELFPRDVAVACQGVEGAYSQVACDRLFRRPDIEYHRSFAGVFRAVAEGACRYGVLPLENSTAGTVSEVYDLMMEHRCFIARTVRVKVDHNLMAPAGAKLADVRDVYSHEQAISQCRRYLSAEPLRGASVHVFPNTAMAARMVAESGRSDVAALCGASCADLYGLVPLAERVQDQPSNFTRFACISKDLQVFPGADRTSLMMTIGHEPGSLYRVLARLYTLGINLTKLESRPIPDRDLEFMFYFDLECPVAAPEFRALVNSLSDVSVAWRYLGSYSEQV